MCCGISFCSYPRVTPGPQKPEQGREAWTSRALEAQRKHALLTVPGEPHVVQGAGEQRGAHARQVRHAQWIS